VIGAGIAKALPEKWKKKKGVSEGIQAGTGLATLFATQSGWHAGLAAQATKKKFTQAVGRSLHEVKPLAQKVFKIVRKLKK
jgi:hypothetical protein